MSEEKSCPICDKKFSIYKFNLRQIFCNSKCRSNAYHRAKKGLPLKLTLLKCAVCDKNFFQSRANHTEYCSRECKKLGVFRKYQGLEVKGARKHVKGSGHITNQGYKMISKNHPNAKCRSPKSGNGQILEHIWIMANHLGRPLAKHETVHHKNGIRNDNRLENLELWSHSHPFGQRVEDKLQWCKEFLDSYGYDVIKREQASTHNNLPRRNV